jgi:hypothetical protein
MDFLTFKSFISTEVLIGFYYIGAVIFPVSACFFIFWLIKKYEFLGISYKTGKEAVKKSLSEKQRLILAALFITIFLFMELFWRMLFEFLIAYMQMRDALLQ